MISIEEALECVLARTSVLGVEIVALEEAAGRVLAEDVTSDLDMPSFDRSAMDGFAVFSQDVASTPVQLPVVGTIPAGVMPRDPLERRTTIRIMTGAPVPEGADAVVRVEDTTELDDGKGVEIHRSVASGRNVDPRGTLVERGAVVLPAGTRLMPAAVGVAASVGCSRVRVRRRPRVGFVSTGDELVEIDALPGPGQIRNSNRYMIESQVRAEGAEMVSSDLVEDTLDATREVIRRHLGRVDLLIFSGGVSMGMYDYVHRAMRAEGIELEFEKVAVKPGKPLCFGRADKTLLFGLPGNPISSYMTFLLFVVSALRKMAGRTDYQPTFVPALLAPETEVTARDRVHFLPIRFDRKDGDVWIARLVPWRGSSDLTRLVGIDGFLEVPPGVKPIGEGECLRVLISEAHIGGSS